MSQSPPPAPGSAPATAQGIAFDARPLTEMVDPNAAREFNRANRVSGNLPVVVLAIAMVVMLAVFGTFASLFFSALASSFNGGNSVSVFFRIVPILFFIALAIIIVRMIVRSRGNHKAYRLSRFAAANGMSFVPRVTDPPLPGMIFQRGRNRTGSELVRGSQPRFVEFGNYRYTTGSGKNQKTVHWGYVAVKLTVPLPNIVLDATGNNSFLGSNLPSHFDKDQRLELEGDFNKFFSLYCPAGYEPDALYLFTPDIMARFIDNAAQMDVEIVDDWLFLYTGREASTLDPATWNWLFTTVGALIDKFDQWARWRDDRLLAAGQPAATGAAGVAAPLPAGSAAATASGQVPLPAANAFMSPPPGVAEGGRRLKKSINWIVVAVVGVFFVIPVLFQLVLPYVMRMFIGQ